MMRENMVHDLKKIKTGLTIPYKFRIIEKKKFKRKEYLNIPYKFHIIKRRKLQEVIYGTKYKIYQGI